MSRQLIGLGKAFELRYRRFAADGTLRREESASFPEFWWAWDGPASSGNIRLVRVVSAADLRPARESKRLHDLFHGEVPAHLMWVEADQMASPLTTFARATAIGYDARGVSDTKGDSRYRHYFGAFTHDDHPPFPEDAMPDIVLDRNNQLMLRRRPSNTFRLENWLVG